jgi:hypothetical protein
MARGGWRWSAFHVDSDEFAGGDVNHPTWFGERVELDTHFLDLGDVVAELEAAGFRVMANVQRRPSPEVEYRADAATCSHGARDPLYARPIQSG